MTYCSQYWMHSNLMANIDFNIFVDSSIIFNNSCMQVKKFDFRSFLDDLVPKITSYTEIHIIYLQPTCIHFTVKWILINKHKTYKIHWRPQEAHHYISLIINHVPLYPIRRLTLSQLQADLYMPFSEVCLDEIIYHQRDKWQELLVFVFNRMKVKKLSFAKSLSFQQIASISRMVHNNFAMHDINLQFNVTVSQQLTMLPVISFLIQWGQSLPDKPIRVIPIQQAFGFPFQFYQQRQCTTRRQQISLYHNGSELITLRQMENKGCEFIFKQPFQTIFYRQIIKELSKFRRFVSLQLQPLDGQTLIEILGVVVNEFECNYRVIVGNQIQLTSSRLTLNTTNLTKEQVMCIVELMKPPGHYQFVCYSTIQHFPAAIELFKSKPLVKFNFFLPLDEVGPLQQLLNKMEKHANQLFLKAYSYAGLLKNHSDKGYFAVNSIFFSLGQRP